jgi:hypothetical protein
MHAMCDGDEPKDADNGKPQDNASGGRVSAPGDSGGRVCAMGVGLGGEAWPSLVYLGLGMSQ